MDFISFFELERRSTDQLIDKNLHLQFSTLLQTLYVYQSAQRGIFNQYED